MQLYFLQKISRISRGKLLIRKMPAYRDFNEINGGNVVQYILQGMSTNSYFHN